MTSPDLPDPDLVDPADEERERSNDEAAEEAVEAAPDG